MQTLLWQKLRFLKFINSFFNPFWRKGKGEKEKGWKVVKRVLPINEPLLQPFTWQRMAFVALLFQLFHGLAIYSFTAYSFLLSSLLLTSYSFSPYYSPLLSLFLPSLPLTPYSFSPYYSPLLSLFLPSLPLTPYYFSPSYFPRLFFKPIHQPLQLLGDG